MLKSKLFLSLLMLASQVHADVGNGSGYPYLAESNCAQSVKVPDNSGGILFNRDCSVGFVLPERVAKATLLARPSYSLKLCSQMDSMLEEAKDYQKIIKVWKQRLQATQDLAQADKIKKFIGDLEASQENARKSVERIEGMRVNVTFVNSSEVPVNNAQEINRELAGKVRFQAAPIAQGRLQYLIESQNEDGIELKSVLRSDIPGNNAIRTGFQGDVDFNGAIQGELILSLSGACPFVKESRSGDKKYFTIDDKSLNQTITANYTYAVPVQSSVSYDATLDSKAALQRMESMTGTADQFYRNDLMDGLLRSTGKEAFTINIRGLENPSTDLTEDFKNQLKSGIAERLTNRFLAILEKNNFVLSSPPIYSKPEVKAGTETGIKRTCRRSSALFGLLSASNCWDVPYTFQVNRGTRTSQLTELSKTWDIPITESAEVNEIIYRVNTSTFNLEPKNPILMEAN